MMLQIDFTALFIDCALASFFAFRFAAMPFAMISLFDLSRLVRMVKQRSINDGPIVAFRSAKGNCFRGAKADYYCSSDLKPDDEG